MFPIQHDQKERRFTISTPEGQEMGFILYSEPEGNTIRATSTKVMPEYGGKGIAGLLLEALVEYAGQNQLKIIPVCSYVAYQFDQHPEKYKEVQA